MGRDWPQIQTKRVLDKLNITTHCIWQRRGKPWPDNKHNYWLTDCGCADHGKLALGLCPHCARPVQARTLEGD